MVPTFSGRLQTRVLLLVVLGVPWTIFISLVAPAQAGASIGHVFEATFWVLGEVIVVGCLVWEPIYHFLMQFRWEKDWPTMFLLLQGIPEGVVAYVLLRAAGPHPHQGASLATFLVDFIPLWVFVWLAAIGPMRVVFHRWRFRGGQIL